MAQLIVNSQNKAYVLNGLALVYKSYDAELEYLVINGNSAINTQIYPTTLDLDIRCKSANGFRFGWDRQNVAAGTWIHMNQTSFTHKDWSTRTMLSEITDTEATSIWRYDMQSGLYKDGTLIKSFTAALGNNDISSIPLYIGNSFDVTANALDPVTSELNIKLKWIQVYRAGTLILDLIPVRVGTVGYMYDKISNTLFGNVGVDPFVLGPDKYNIPENYTEVECLESTGIQYINTLYEPTENTTLIVDAQLTDTTTAFTIAGLIHNNNGLTQQLKRFHIGTYQSNWHFGCSASSATSSWINFATPVVDANRHTFELRGSGYCRIDDTTNQINASAGNYEIPIYLFARNQFVNSTADSFSKVKIYNVKIYENNTLVKNFVPVRDNNNIGYLYDTVERQIFSNSGTGNFLLGKDVENSLEKMVLVRHWNGADELSSGKWYDKIANQYWTLTNATHQTGYYEFTNSSATSATSNGLLNGALPDLGYHWKIIVDAAVKYKSSGIAIAVDFGSYGQVTSGKCAVQIALADTSKKWSFNTKFNGNDSASTYTPSTANLEETGIANGDWVRRTVTIGVRASATVGKDETYVIVSDLGTGASTTPYTPIQFNRWESGKSYIARSLVAPSGTYPTATCVKIYSIKVYKES